jgi:glycerol-3-phosphate cytidylyltransferase
MIVYTGGTFDLFHSGHIRLLKKCYELAGSSGRVIVSVNPDEFCAQYKEPPICDLAERMEVVRGCKWVHEVIVNSGGADSRPAIIESNAKLIVVGSDWQNKDYYKQMGFDQDWLDQRSISIEFVSYTEGISTTIIKSKILDRMFQ